MKNIEEEMFKDKKIHVTGGTGSIGRMIVFELLKCAPPVIRIFDIDEARESLIEMYVFCYVAM